MFSLEENNYTALVFAGKAALGLGKREEAKQFYKKAIAVNTEDQLAWKVIVFVYMSSHTSQYVCGGVTCWNQFCVLCVTVVPRAFECTFNQQYYVCVVNVQGLADFYDKQSPQDQRECLDAIGTFERLLQIISR